MDPSPPLAGLSIVALAAAHWPDVRRIIDDGIGSGHATFETAAPTWEAFDAARLADHRWVAVDPRGQVVGWTAVAATSARACYAGVVEHSVYVAAEARGHGVGTLLLDALVGSTEAAGIWTIESGIFPENTASLALHRRAGFREVGRRERIGQMRVGPMAGQWRDYVLIERRSPVVGR